MDFYGENDIYNPTEVWDVPNIIQICLVTWNNVAIILNPVEFNHHIANKSVNEGDNTVPNNNTDKHDPVSGYEILEENFSKISVHLNRKRTAYAEKRNDGNRFNILFHIDTSPLVSRQFKEFNAGGTLQSTARRWLYVDLEDTSYTGYYRIFYRKLEDYYNYINCGENNVDIDVYANNSNCARYINSNNRYNWVADSCIRNSNDQKYLFGDVCTNIISNDNVNTDKKRNIVAAQMKWCATDPNNLLNDSKCKQFWSVGFDSKKGFLKEDKNKYLDSVARDNICKPGHNNYPFCNCLLNEKKKDVFGEVAATKIPDMCLTEFCNETAYRPSNYDEVKCPSYCIQTISGHIHKLKMQHRSVILI